MKEAWDSASREVTAKGMELMQVKKFDGVTQKHNRAATFDPRNATAVWGLEVCFSDKGHTEEALPSLNRAIALDPKQGQFYNNRTAVFTAKKDYSFTWAEHNRCLQARKTARSWAHPEIKGRFQTKIH